MTVAAHLRALEKRVPKLAPVYRMMSGRLVEMAAQKGLDTQAVARLKEVLEHK